ncbi:hypothetical protein [Neisseria sp. 74A18]|uniref:hypothetical protein n=1 Tax=Neisseria sp. 74A18 TaxID=1696094 RepID=UPI0006CAE3BE|nr:hypothetical protein [Neisseria sp. 74A18]KPN73980.1 hypothetical protein AKG43_05270 [Neisseria sp. 74A18]
MNLYGPIDRHFSGWRIDPKENFGTSDWRPISTPKASDYVRTSPPALPKPSDYVPISKTEQPAIPSVSAIIDTTPKTINGSKDYSVQELQKIGSSSPREIAGFFQNLNGTTIQQDTSVDGHVLKIYTNPALPDKEYVSYGENKGFWQIVGTAPRVSTSDNSESIPGVSVAAKREIQLSGSEIAAVIQQQNNPLPPELPKPEELPSVSSDSGAVVLSPLPVPQEKPSIERLSSIGSNIITGDIPRNPPEFKPAPDVAVQNPQKPPPQTAETAPAEPHPESQALGALGDAVTYTEAALKNPHQELMKQLDQLKVESSFSHNTAAELSKNIIQLEEGHLYGERREFYAQNKEALSELAEKLRTETTEIVKAEGELAGKLYYLKGIAKTLGFVGIALDMWELGSRIKTAVETDNWDPVAGSLAKIALTPVAVAGGVLVGAGAGFLVAGMGVPAAIATGITVVVSAGTTYLLIQPLDSLDKEISESGKFDFGETSQSRPLELVLAGNYNHQDDVKLEADHITVIGRQNFQNLELKAESFTVIGEANVAGNLNVAADRYENIAPENVSPEFAEQLKQTGQTVAEHAPPETAPEPSVQQEGGFVLTEEPAINLEYAQAQADADNSTVKEYVSGLLEPINAAELPFPDLYDSIIQYQNEELERIFGDNAIEDAFKFIGQEDPAYPQIPPSQPLPDMQENTQL